MPTNRNDVLDWAEQGRIAPGRLRAALELSGALPSAADWRLFLDRMLLWMGAVMLAAGTIFFFAFNWQELGRRAKIGLAEILVLAALVLVWRLGLERASGKASLLAASILVGALLALIGQIYQTGADTYELFAVWAAAILPWALTGRLPVLWIVWLALVNLALSLYFLTFGLLWGLVFAPERLAWLLFGLNTVALVVWDTLAASGIEWLRERWSVRILAAASGAAITGLAMHDILEWPSASGWGAPLWLAWLAAAYAVYRHRIKDLFVLAGGVLSVIVVAATFLGKHLHMRDAGAFLFIGLVVIGLSAAGGWWLKSVANEENEREDAIRVGILPEHCTRARSALCSSIMRTWHGEPVVFLSHGSPMVALADDAYTRALARLGAERPRPRAVVCVSAHWQARPPVRVTGSPQPPLIYDFGGFPPELYRLTYPAPGAPDLAAEIVSCLCAAGVPAALDPVRGLDHGVWVPLRLISPTADVPVVAVSLPAPATPAQLVELGRALAPLRAQGVLLVGSGGIVHNLGRLRAESDQVPDAWAREFDDWVRARLEARDLDALVDYRRAGPHADLAVPTTEHLDPLFVVLGAADDEDRVADVYAGFQHGNLSMRSFVLTA